MPRNTDWSRGARRTTWNRQILPSYGQGLELRSLLPNLTTNVTGTKPCKGCAQATPNKKRDYCYECRPRQRKAA